MGDNIVGALSYEEWRVEKILEESDLVCPSCGEELHVAEDLILLQVVIPSVVEGRSVDVPLEEGGGYKYEPHFFHSVCWNSLWEDFLEKETYPKEDDAPHLSLFECEMCGTAIRQGEMAGTITLGEIKCSERTPLGHTTTHFSDSTFGADHLCTSCLFIYNDEVIGVWDDMVFGTVCPKGVDARCWRDGGCGGGCRLRR